jgi:glycosyltransferase involved in cell wall biosynthesis
LQKLLVLTTGLDVGGAEMQVYNLVTKLKSDGSFSPIIVSLISPGLVGEMLKMEDIPVYSLDMKRGRPSAKAIIKLLRIIHNEQINLIHSHMYHANLLARFIKIIIPNINVISTIHSINIGSKCRENLLRVSDFLSNLTTVISDEARKHFLRKGVVTLERSCFIPNGIDTNFFKYDSKLRIKKRNELGISDQLVWLAVGRFVEAKNYPNLLAAYKKVLSKNKNSRLYIVGTGITLNKIKQLAFDLKISEWVEFLGERKDINELMNAADCYVMSSNWEGLPLVLLEAASTSLPIIATDVGGNKEVIINNKTGFLVEPNNPDLLAEKMIELMNLSEASRIQLGENARNYINDKFNIDNVVNTWVGVYHQVMGNLG